MSEMVWRRRPRVSTLTQEQREALVDRSAYDAPGGVPEHYDERFPVTCRLCGREVTVTLANLHPSDQDREMRAQWGAPRNRTRCHHPRYVRPARPPRAVRSNPGALNQEDAQALLAALGPLPDDADRVTRRAVKRLKYIAQED